MNTTLWIASNLLFGTSYTTFQLLKTTYEVAAFTSKFLFKEKNTMSRTDFNTIFLEADKSLESASEDFVVVSLV